MLFVPIVPSGPQAPPSPRVRELSELLGRVIDEYGKHHPSLTGTEVRQAVRLASRGASRSGDRAPVRVLLAGIVAALVAAGVAVFVLREGSGGEAAPVAAFGALLLLVILVAVFIERVRDL